MGKERYFIVRDAAVPMPQEWHEWDGCPVLTLVASEEHKTIASLQRVWDFLMENGATRSDIVVNIGGGYISDIGGMAAATYRRGMRYINVPTTLLAMVDASVGGKTGINYRGMKNYVGVFHAPEEVRLYPHFLRTLPNRELLSGFAELLKTALLDSEQFAGDAMAWLEDWSEHGWTTDLSERLEELIRRAVACKERYVASDPYDQGLRHALNLGHTIGHAIEEVQMGKMPHGYAVMFGLVAELYLSVVLQGLDRRWLQQVTSLMVSRYHRPECKCSDYDRLITLMHEDKKNEDEEHISFVLLPAIGRPVNAVVSETLIREALEYLFSC